jgi:hypothetical protein
LSIVVYRMLTICVCHERIACRLFLLLQTMLFSVAQELFARSALGSSGDVGLRSDSPLSSGKRLAEASPTKRRRGAWPHLLLRRRPRRSPGPGPTPSSAASPAGEARQPPETGHRSIKNGQKTSRIYSISRIRITFLHQVQDHNSHKTAKTST